MTTAPPVPEPQPNVPGRKPDGPLRKGWTTGACATAATAAAYRALLTGEFPDPVTITLPKGGWLRLADGGIARLAKQVSLAKGETQAEAKLLRITTPVEVERIPPTQFIISVYLRSVS